MHYNILQSFQFLLLEDRYFLYCALKAVLHLPSFVKSMYKSAYIFMKEHSSEILKTSIKHFLTCNIL